MDRSNPIPVKVVAQVPCDPMSDVVGAKGIVYFACQHEVVAVDLATDQVVARYGHDTFGTNIVLDGFGHLWFGGSYVDLHSGTITDFNVLSGGSVIDAGIVLAGANDDVFLSNEAGILSLIHPSKASLPSVQVAQQLPPAGAPEPACRSAIVEQTVSHYPDTWTRITKPFAFETNESGHVAGSLELGGWCWLLMDDTELRPSPRMHAIRLGRSGVDLRSPELPLQLAVLDNTLWATTPTSVRPVLFQRVDPATWRPMGAVFSVDCLSSIVAAEGSVWCLGATSYQRLDLPLDHVVPATPTITPTASANVPPATPTATTTATP